MLRRAAEREPEVPLLGLEYAMFVVEAVEVVRNADRVRRNAVRRAPLRRLGDEGRELREPFDQVALLSL